MKFRPGFDIDAHIEGFREDVRKSLGLELYQNNSKQTRAEAIQNVFDFIVQRKLKKVA